MRWNAIIVALLITAVVFSVGYALGVNPTLLAGISAGLGAFHGPLIQRWLDRNKPHYITISCEKAGDVLDRLLEAETKDSGGAVIDDYQYTYDSAGNRLTQTVNGTTTSYTYNNANELTAAGSTTYSYDANGNLSGSSAGLSLSYNALN